MEKINTKKFVIILILISLLVSITGCGGNDKLTKEELSELTDDEINVVNEYYKNQKIINKVKDELYAIDCDDISLYYLDNKIKTTYNIYINEHENLKKYTSKYFQKFQGEPTPEIWYRELFGDKVVEFSFYDHQQKAVIGLLYTEKPEIHSQIIKKIDDNWYLFIFHTY